MNSRTRILGIAAVAITLAACSSSTPNATAQDAATKVQTSVSDVTKLVTITADNDPNNLIGRPNGYTAATVLYDGRASCEKPSTDCGATIEQWPNQKDAQARADYIQGILKASPMLGSEYDYVSGNLLLRVTGKLSADQAAAYKAALTQ